MKIALLGKGQTGGRVLELHEGETTVFDTTNPVTSEKLKGHDVIISFLPGEAFRELIPTLLESGIPVVTGSTGFEWPSDISDRLIQKNISWVKAHNFSLGMNLMRHMIDSLSRASALFDDFKFTLHEVHHTKKIDAPSGTALSWAEWLNAPIDISSERTGDVVGDHSLTLETLSERITLRHEALIEKFSLKVPFGPLKKSMKASFQKDSAIFKLLLWIKYYATDLLEYL